MPPRRSRPRPRDGRRDPNWQPGPSSQFPLKGPIWDHVRKYVLDRDSIGRMVRCHACGHFSPRPGMGVDHDPVPLTECEAASVNPFDVRNLKAIHHARPCETCVSAAAALGNQWSGFCNAKKSSGSVMRFRLLCATATGLEICGVKPGKAPVAGRPVTGERPW